MDATSTTNSQPEISIAGTRTEDGVAVRDAKGHFLPGRRPKGFCPGRPRGNKSEELRRKLQDAVGSKRFLKLVREIYTQALTAPEAKDRREACKYLIDQLIGKAGQAITVNGSVETNTPEDKRAAVWERFHELQGKN